MFVRIDGACSVQRLVQIFLCLGVVAHWVYIPARAMSGFIACHSSCDDCNC